MRFGSFQEFLGMDEFGAMNIDDFYSAMNKIDAGNDIVIDVHDFMRALKENGESVCKPYERSIKNLLKK